MNILWIENHKPFADAVIREFLSDCVVTVCESIEESVLLLASTQFDVILIDYDLNNEKGTSIFPYLNQIENSIPVIAVSSHDAGNNELMSAGASDFCAKMDFRNIRNKIASVVVGND